MFLLGAVGDKFYYILYGSVKVIVKKNEDTVHKEMLEQKHRQQLEKEKKEKKIMFQKMV